MTEMRVLTVRQPWAWAIIHGGKDVENRVRNIAGAYRGTVAIHAALKEDDEAFYDSRIDSAMDLTPSWEQAHGAIIGVVDLVDVHKPHAGLRAVGRGEAGGKSWGTWESCSSWAEADAYHLMLANPRPLSEPIPFRGALGLRRLDDNTQRLIEERQA